MIVLYCIVLHCITDAIEEAEGNVLKLYLVERKKKVSRREADVLDTMVNGVVTINKKGKIVFFNKAAEKCWGYGRAEVLKRNVKVLVFHKDVLAYLCTDASIMVDFNTR